MTIEVHRRSRDLGARQSAIDRMLAVKLPAKA